MTVTVDDVKMIVQEVIASYDSKIREEVQKALDEKLGHLYVEREQHFLDHTYILRMRTMSDKITGQACKVITQSAVVGLIIIVIYGLEGWLKRGLSSILGLFK